MYINGRFLGSVEIPSSYDTRIDTLKIGNFLGETDEFVLYDRELTFEEVVDNFQSKYRGW
jgi:hypothetical protein